MFSLTHAWFVVVWAILFCFVLCVTFDKIYYFQQKYTKTVFAECFVENAAIQSVSKERNSTVTRFY